MSNLEKIKICVIFSILLAFLGKLYIFWTHFEQNFYQDLRLNLKTFQIDLTK